MNETALGAPPLPTLAPGEGVDVTLLLEGTYPYVYGGVSSWIHEIISGLPTIRFAAVFLGSQASDYGPVRYRFPSNLVHVEAHYLMQALSGPKPRETAGNPLAAAMSVKLHQELRQGGGISPDVLAKTLSTLGEKGAGITQSDFLFARSSWRQIVEAYHEHCTDPSFVDYFWTVRTMHAPIFLLARLAESMPPTRAVHAVSTGYAGLLGALMVARRHIPFALTEHGIYTKERRIDLAQATWIKDPDDGGAGIGGDESSYARGLWIRFFEDVGRMAYLHADPIISLYEGNRQRQIADGADAGRTQVIPNGIELERFEALVAGRPASIPPVVALIGRVVPIKDILGFIRAMRIVCSQRPQVEGWIVGPEDENPDYAKECHRLVATLGLQDQVKFTGFQKPEDILPRVGLTMLTSISEALPLAVLESLAGGVPVVATDVGACRELLEGKDATDRALGAAGLIVPIANPEAAAKAVLTLLDDPPLWQRQQQAGQRRVRATYGRQRMFQSYQAIYQSLVEGPGGRNRI